MLLAAYSQHLVYMFTKLDGRHIFTMHALCIGLMLCTVGTEMSDSVNVCSLMHRVHCGQREHTKVDRRFPHTVQIAASH